jgi:hypothetical protein
MKASSLWYNSFRNKGGVLMSPGMLKMWISIAGMGLMFLAIITIYLSRYKLKGILKVLTAVLAYIFLIISGITLFVVLFT